MQVCLRRTTVLALVTGGTITTSCRDMTEPQAAHEQYTPPSLAVATGSGDQKILFYSNRDGDFEIYVMSSDGSGETRLTHQAGDDENPTWSPDGRRIAFQAVQGGRFYIYTMAADGSDLIRLTMGPASISIRMVARRKPDALPATGTAITRSMS